MVVLQGTSASAEACSCTSLHVSSPEPSQNPNRTEAGLESPGVSTWDAAAVARCVGEGSGFTDAQGTAAHAPLCRQAEDVGVSFSAFSSWAVMEFTT